MINLLRVGWMNYANDPWAQITRHFEPSNLGGRITTSSLRYLFSTHSWGPIPFGYWFFDNLLNQLNKTPTGFLSSMEQEASHNSGDTYSTIGSLHAAPSVIGDVGRYWITANGASRYGSSGGAPGGSPQDFIAFGQQDAPGVNLSQLPVLAQGPSNPPNSSVLNAATVLPANSVPEDFYNLDKAGNFTNIGPRGWIPVCSRLERSLGVQVAFTRPNPNTANQYKVTATVGDASNADQAQQKNSEWRLTVPINISDVALTIATLPVAEAVAPTDFVSLIPFQRAAWVVTPNGNRVYRPTPAEPGFIVDVSGSDLVAHSALGVDDVEFSCWTPA